MAFGDLASSGAWAQHERLLGPVGLEVVEPLWSMTSEEAVDRCLRTGIHARVVVVDDSVLGPDLLGRALDRALVDALPPGCDPGGELGEYHTLVVDAPFFSRPVRYRSEGVQTIEHVIGTSRGAETFRHHRLRCRAATDEHGGSDPAG